MPSMRVQLQLSRYGMVFIPVLAAMLLAAINYDNNLVYLILFLLGSMLIISAVYTYRNMAFLEIKPGHMWPVFAGGTFRYTLQVVNHAPHPLYSLTFKRFDSRDDQRVRCDFLSSGAVQEVEFMEAAPRRGRYTLHDMEIASLFPFGLFRASIKAPLNWDYIVYPRLQGERPWPESEPDVRTQDDGHYRGGESFYGLRNYQAGESQRHIDWKAVARGRPLMVKEFASSGTGRLWFDWKQIDAFDPEEKLSQLAIWVVQADQVGVPYGLRLPEQNFTPAMGPIYLQTCLTALALHPGKRS